LYNSITSAQAADRGKLKQIQNSKKVEAKNLELDRGRGILKTVHVINE
jgi:hypothetical protein